MKVVRVKSIFKGQVGFPEKYLTDDLLVVVGEESMFVPKTKFSEGKLGKELYNDKYGGDPYRLVYFNWKPKATQEKLL